MVGATRVKGVVFNVGYTLVDETRRWREWAEWLGVEPEKRFDVMRRAIADGVYHSEALKRLKPGFDFEREKTRRLGAGKVDEFRASYLYPDVAPCISRLKSAGLAVGAAGNSTEEVERFLTQCDLGFDMIGSSERWGVEKPDPRYFLFLAQAMKLPTRQLAYIGDRLDNDIAPAAAAGMVAIFIRRGLWAEVLEGRPEQDLAHAVIDSLDALPGALA